MLSITDNRDPGMTIKSNLAYGLFISQNSTELQREVYFLKKKNSWKLCGIFRKNPALRWNEPKFLHQINFNFLLKELENPRTRVK